MRVEGLSCDMDGIFKYLFGTCDNNAPIRVDQRMKYRKVLHAIVAVMLEVRGVNVVAST